MFNVNNRILGFFEDRRCLYRNRIFKKKINYNILKYCKFIKVYLEVDLKDINFKL